jgi:hypothetical protein
VSDARELIAELVDAGLDPIQAGDIIARAMLIGASNAGPQKSARQLRNARYYQNKKETEASEKRLKASYSDGVLKRLNSDESVLNKTPLARVEDSSSNIEISGGEEKDKSLPQIDREFADDFWPAYPLKRDRGHALKAYRAARKRASVDVIMAGVRRYAAERAGDDPKFTKYAQGWLNGDGWADEPRPSSRPTATAPPSHAAQVDDVLNSIINGKSHAAYPGPTIDSGYERADRGNAAVPLRLNAPSSRQ